MTCYSLFNYALILIELYKIEIAYWIYTRIISVIQFEFKSSYLSFRCAALLALKQLISVCESSLHVFL